MTDNILNFKHRTKNWGPIWITLLGGLAAFGCYTSMYAFRKAFSAATFTDVAVFGVDYKILLVITQMIGYTASKFYGVKYIAETDNKNRAKSIVKLILVSWFALLGLAICPSPYNLFFMVINGFPLGMIWGLVFSYLEGRKTTEFMGAILSTTLIFASGFIKTVARLFMELTHVSELWMPFCIGAIFLAPLLLFVFLLEMIPPPTEEDKKLRTKRIPMNGEARKSFIKFFLPGILVTVIIYVVFTVLRDVRDNFEVEIWKGLGINSNHIFTQIDSIISLVILVILGLLIVIRNNLKAFIFIHFMIICGCLLVLLASFLFHFGHIGSVLWMSLIGIGLFMAYIPYNAVFFERFIATYHYKSNIGFLIYIADAFGYLASVSILVFKEWGSSNISWLSFFQQLSVIGALIGLGCGIFSLIYFKRKASTHSKKEPSTKKLPQKKIILT